MKRKLTDFKKKKKKRINFYKNPENIKATQIKIKCSICKKKQTITVNDISIYDEELISTFECWRCEFDKKYGLTWKARLEKKGLI